MFNNIPPITRNIIILNIIVFIIANIKPDFLYANLSAFYPFSPFFKSWQVITHMFMHGGITHIAFNMLTLYSFGPILEQTLGDKRYLILYFLSGLGAFLLFNGWNFLEVQQITSSLEDFGFNIKGYLNGEDVQYVGNSLDIVRQQELLKNLKHIMTVPMVGASGAIFGVVAAFTTIYPNTKLMMMFIPIPIKAKYIMPIVILVSIGLGVSGNNGGIAHLAHVGGALVGYLLAKNWKKHLYRFN